MAHTAVHAQVFSAGIFLKKTEPKPGLPALLLLHRTLLTWARNCRKYSSCNQFVVSQKDLYTNTRSNFYSASKQHGVQCYESLQKIMPKIILRIGSVFYAIVNIRKDSGSNRCLGTDQSQRLRRSYFGCSFAPAPSVGLFALDFPAALTSIVLARYFFIR